MCGPLVVIGFGRESCLSEVTNCFCQCSIVCFLLLLFVCLFGWLVGVG